MFVGQRMMYLVRIVCDVLVILFRAIGRWFVKSCFAPLGKGLLSNESACRLIVPGSTHHSMHRSLENVRFIDDFRGACAVKGNVQVAGRTSSVSTTQMLSTHDVTLRNVDGSLFHVQI